MFFTSNTVCTNFQSRRVESGITQHSLLQQSAKNLATEEDSTIVILTSVQLVDRFAEVEVSTYVGTETYFQCISVHTLQVAKALNACDEFSSVPLKPRNNRMRALRTFFFFFWLARRVIPACLLYLYLFIYYFICRMQ
jgi:hypothetical protein